ncbi:SDR family oxidoreductase [Solemya velesiana gill symbiont]|uniref:Short-chain dehydrogenase n=1 Tax=Solemya velesiana gill symbiont TaxID=1918948 RepID=A0A1T2KUW7_9GAMM|nr:SDR family oxidoreductase [Solemya velesiana gill symbiont]OOZ36635.1 short-chain dehydrogenase [Solemya velesiana gill symbiont]
MSTLHSRPVLITGCSSGIGLCCALGLKSRGYPVFATARRERDLEMLESQGLEALYLELEDRESIEKAVEQVLSKTNGKLYGLFNNGAYGQPGAVEDLSTEVLKRQFEVNLFSWHHLTRLVLPVMRRQGEGRIIQNSSVLGFVAMKYRGAYNASKYALEGLSDTLRLELEGSGVYVSLVEPGPITSKFRENAYRKWQENIEPEGSPHEAAYRALEERLTKKGPAVPFTLPPEAVLKRVIHALESSRPQPRYYVTFPTYLFGALKRVLSTRVLDALARKY